MAGDAQESCLREISAVVVVGVSSSAWAEKIEMKRCQIDPGDGKVSLMEEV